MPKVLILTGDAAEALEVIYPHQRLTEEGYEAVVAALSAKSLQLVVHEMVPGNDTFVEKPGYHWPADVAFSDVNPSDYAAIIIPGGRAPEYIRNNPDFIKNRSTFFQRELAGGALVPRLHSAGHGGSSEGASYRRVP